MTTRWVALFRGLNVGGHRKLPMQDLRNMLTLAGLDDVTTYIQSGNAVFTASGTREALGTRIETALASDCDVETRVMLRTGDEMRAIAANHPLSDGADIKRLAVAFLEASPDATSIAAFDPNQHSPDQCLVTGDHVFVHAPSGFGKTKLTNNWLERQLGRAATTRNWNTVLRLTEMTT